MHTAATIVAATATLAISTHALGAAFTVDNLSVSVSHALQVESGAAHLSRLQITGDIGPVTAADAGGAGAVVDIVLALDFSFIQNSIAGDLLVSMLHLRPQFDSGSFQVLNIGLTASLYDDGQFVYGVAGEPNPPQQNIGDGVQRSIVVFTDTFEGPGPAFSTIGDGGHGRLEAAFRWSGFGAGDALTIDFAPDGMTSSLQYWNFIPAPGAAMALGALPLLLRRRR